MINTKEYDDTKIIIMNFLVEVVKGNLNFYNKKIISF